VIVQAVRRCGTCKESVSSFRCHARGRKPHFSYECFDCQSISNRSARYGLTKDEVSKQTEKTHCPICGRAFGHAEGQHFDHNPNTGKFRDVLCRRCNQQLSSFDQPEWHAKLAAYHAKHEAAT